MRLLLFALLFTLPQVALADDPAAPTIKLPETVKAKPAEITELKVETAGKVVKWVALTPGLSLRPIDGGKTLLFSGPPGKFDLLCYTAAGDVPSDPARVTVVIELPQPLPPPPPPPDTRLRDKLSAAMVSDKGLKADVLQLAAIYREAAKVAVDPAVPDSATLLTRLRKVSEGLIGSDALPSVRAAAAEELLAALGMTSDEPLTDAQRARAAQTFLKLASNLEELAK